MSLIIENLPSEAARLVVKVQMDPNRTTVSADDSAAPQIKTHILVFIETFLSLVVINHKCFLGEFLILRFAITSHVKSTF